MTRWNAELVEPDLDNALSQHHDPHAATSEYAKQLVQEMHERHFGHRMWKFVYYADGERYTMPEEKDMHRHLPFTQEEVEILVMRWKRNKCKRCWGEHLKTGQRLGYKAVLAIRRRQRKPISFK